MTPCIGCDSCAAATRIPFRLDEKLCVRCMHYVCQLAPWRRVASKR